MSLLDGKRYVRKKVKEGLGETSRTLFLIERKRECLAPFPWLLVSDGQGRENLRTTARMSLLDGVNGVRKRVKEGIGRDDAPVVLN
jgi:hypothetical protein